MGFLYSSTILSEICESGNRKISCIRFCIFRNSIYPLDEIQISVYDRQVGSLETGETDTEIIQKKLDEAICAINDLQEEFDENDSDIPAKMASKKDAVEALRAE